MDDKEPAPRRWFQPLDHMRHFSDEKPLVKLCALVIVMFPRNAFAVVSLAGIVWRFTHLAVS